MKKYLIIDGGGLMGIIPLCSLAFLEKSYNISHDYYYGTSTGAVILGLKLTGHSYKDILSMYVNDVPKLFKPRNRFNPVNWLPRNWERYDKQPFIESIKSKVGEKKFGEINENFTVVVYNQVNGTPCFISTRDVRYQDYKIYEVLSWVAMSAVYYFGEIRVPDFLYSKFDASSKYVGQGMGGILFDGGQTSYMSMEELALIHAYAMHHNEEVRVNHFGTGIGDRNKSYQELCRQNMLHQIHDFFMNQRESAPLTQAMSGYFVSENNNNVKCETYNIILPKKIDKLDGVEYVKEYEKYGEEMLQTNVIRYNRNFEVLNS